jgi:hypothetical protein
MAGVSPTQNSLSALRAQGYTCWVVEYWNSFTRKRVDMFGMFDIIAIRENETLAVQTTTSGVAARVKKITDSEYLDAVRKAGWRIEVHGWRKAPKVKGGKAQIWKQRIVDMS